MTRQTLALTGAHLGGNALLLWLGYYWLGLGESRTSALLGSALLALVLFALACWLQGATFAYFSVETRDLKGAFRAALRHLPALVATALLLLGVYLVLARWAGGNSDRAYTVASWLTLRLRKPVKPGNILRVFNAVFWLVRWMLIPVVVLPLLPPIARGAGLHAASRGRLYWLEVPVLLWGALGLPFVLIGWVPQAGRFWVEIVSFAARFLAAYLLFVGAWLVLVRVTSAGRPVRTQARTAVSP